MMAYLHIDRVLGTGGSHFLSIDCSSKFAAALMLIVMAILLPVNNMGVSIQYSVIWIME
jgi:hypothetical protein